MGYAFSRAVRTPRRFAEPVDSSWQWARALTDRAEHPARLAIAALPALALDQRAIAQALTRRDKPAALTLVRAALARWPALLVAELAVRGAALAQQVYDHARALLPPTHTFADPLPSWSAADQAQLLAVIGDLRGAGLRELAEALARYEHWYPRPPAGLFAALAEVPALGGSPFAGSLRADPHSWLAGWLTAKRVSLAPPPATSGFSGSFLLRNPATRAWLSELGASLVTGVDPAMSGRIRETLVAGLDAGATPQAIMEVLATYLPLDARRLAALDRYVDAQAALDLDPDTLRERIIRQGQAYANRRAEVIVRTELLGAENAGQLALWGDALSEGLFSADETRREWVVTPDERLCPICELMRGQLVAMDKPFKTPRGREIMHAPAHPQCRCTSVLTFVDEKGRKAA